MRPTKWLLGLVLTGIAVCQQPALTVQGLDGKTVTVTSEDLTRLPQHSIKASDHGTTATFEGVLFSDILAKVNLPVGDNLKGKALSQFLVAEAADGYRVLFALPELDPALTDHPVYLATSETGNRSPIRKGRSELFRQMTSIPLVGCDR